MLAGGDTGFTPFFPGIGLGVGEALLFVRFFLVRIALTNRVAGVFAACRFRLSGHGFLILSFFNPPGEFLFPGLGGFLVLGSIAFPLGFVYARAPVFVFSF